LGCDLKIIIGEASDGGAEGARFLVRNRFVSLQASLPVYLNLVKSNGLRQAARSRGERKTPFRRPNGLGGRFSDLAGLRWRRTAGALQRILQGAERYRQNLAVSLPKPLFVF
jgi:hypothetical protein